MGVDLRDNPTTKGGVPLTKLDAPEEQDGKPVVVTAPFTEGLYMFITSRGDDLVEGVIGRGTGDKMLCSFAGTETGDDQTQEAMLTFHETVEMHDGHADYDPAKWDEDDEWSVFIRINGTPVTVNGSATGNCDLVAAQAFSAWDSGTSYNPGDFVTAPNGANYVCIQAHSNQQPPNATYWLNTANVVVPAAGDGGYDVDLSTAICVPYEGGGYWDYDVWTDTFTPSASPGSADWMLFDFAMDDVYIMRNMMASSHLGYWEIDAYKVEPIYPRWQFGLRVYRHDADSRGAAKFAGHFTCFRQDTT